jgi:chromosome segregation ATPase
MTYTRTDHEDDIRKALEQRHQAVAGGRVFKRPRSGTLRSAADVEFMTAVATAGDKLEAAHQTALERTAVVADARFAELSREREAHAKTRAELRECHVGAIADLDEARKALDEARNQRNQTASKLEAEQGSHAAERATSREHFAVATKLAAELDETRKELKAEREAHAATRAALNTAASRKLTNAAHATMPVDAPENAAQQAEAKPAKRTGSGPCYGPECDHISHAAETAPATMPTKAPQTGKTTSAAPRPRTSRPRAAKP